MMKLAFSTNAFTRFTLIEALRQIKAAGFGGVEILADVPHAYPDAVGAAQVGAIVRELEKLDLQVSNINANCSFGYWRHAPPEPFFEPSLISPVREHREDRARLICKALEFGKAVGAANVSITTGRMLAGMPPEKAAQQLAESLPPILDRADRLGVSIGIECEPGLFVEHVAELREWIDRLGHARLGANLDIGHSQVMGESIGGVIRLLGDRIWNMHVEDIPGRKHYHLIPGRGTVDWGELQGGVEAIGYGRFLTVELYTYTENPRAAAEESYEFLCRRLH
jgi:sugar phosphate isomerase/epimerase